MSKSIPRVWGILIAVLAMAVAGCVQDVGDAGRENAVAQLLPSDTPTDVPTAPPPTETSTPTPEASPQDVLAEFSTASETATPTSTPQAVAQAPTTDPFLLTATQLYLNATATVEFSITQTAAALGIGATPTEFPTFTFTPSPTLESGQPGGGSVVAPGTTCIHIVSPGENLFRLSLRYGVSVNQLAAASGIVNPNLIIVGQNIIIPGCGTTGIFPPPTPVGTLSGQGAGTGGTVSRPGIVHVVQQYETLFQLSLRYGVPVNSIAAANGITNINRIFMGQELIIPPN